MLFDDKLQPSASADDPEVMVSFNDVTKSYKLYKNDRMRFFGLFSSRVPFEGVDANKHLSFSIRRGESVAFLGRNGAGKSTALKMITEVLYPTEGTVSVNGRVSALLELTAGFDNQLTGRENLAMRAQVLGLSPEEFVKLEPKMIEFAEIGSYIDQPVRTYSSGMRARLGFAFAVFIDPEILIIDEALSVGDKKFKAKCLARVKEIMAKENLTVLFVTHSSPLAKDFCKRGIVLKHGEMIFDGDISEAIDCYDTNC